MTSKQNSRPIAIEGRDRAAGCLPAGIGRYRSRPCRCVLRGSRDPRGFVETDGQPDDGDVGDAALEQKLALRSKALGLLTEDRLKQIFY